MFQSIFNLIGRKTLHFFSEFGKISILLKDIILSLSRLWRDRKLTAVQMDHIGVGSLPLVTVIGISTGAIAAWQAAYQFKGLVPNSLIGSATSRVIFLELGPVLTGIIIAGRVGASIAAEIGTMKVTEQIDALNTMAISPTRFLATPRFLASIVMLPVLVIYADAVAVLGSFMISNSFLDISSNVFFTSVQKFFKLSDLLFGLHKSIVFGALTSLIGCHIGFSTEGGAEGVGTSTIKAFVISSASILIADYILWSMFF